MKANKNMIVCFILFLLIGCKGTADQIDIRPLGINIPQSEVNTRFKMSAPEGWNTFKTSDEIAIDVAVLTNDQIAFTNDYGSRLFILQDQSWIEVQNITEYKEGYVVLSNPGKDLFKHGGTNVHPRLSVLDAEVTVMVVFVGNEFVNGTIGDTETAGYLLVNLIP